MRSGNRFRLPMQDGDEAVYVAHAFVPSRFSLNNGDGGAAACPSPRRRSGGPSWPSSMNPSGQRSSTGWAGPPIHAAHRVQRQAFTDLLDSIRLRGFAFSESEYVQGVSSIALPVFDRARG